MNKGPNNEPSTPFRIGEWVVEPGSGRICKNGVEVKLEPKVMEVLAYLARHQGTVVSHEMLEAEIWTGTIVGYGSVPATIIKLRKALGDNSRKPRYIETVSKRGYRLIMPVSPAPEETRASDNNAATDDALSISKRKTVRRAVTLALLGLCIGLAVLVVELDWPGQPGRTSSEIPSVVVLPFKNFSDDPREAHLSDGITDDLITDLSRIKSVRVLARQTSYYYKNRKVTPEDVFRQLNVLYIIEGSVRKSGKHIRVNVQLSNAKQGENIWAERIDTDTENIFSTQDKIVKDVVQAMYVTLSTKGATPPVLRGTRSFDAYDAFLLGQKYSKNRSRQGYEQTINAYKRAIEIDPGYARAYGALAVTLTRGYRYLWSDLSMVEARERAMMFARKAIVLDTSTPQIYWSLGYVHLHRREYDEAEEAARKSVSLSPSYADGYALLANIVNWRGKPVDAEKYVKKAIELNPYYSFQYPSTLGTAYYHQGRYQEAVTVLKTAQNQNEMALNPHIYLAAAYTELGRGEEAAWEITQIDINHPGTRLSELRTILPYEKKSYMETLVSDLRKAGMSE
ncbi:MAG: winged helix-turn-helix domain-containing protein [Proteobacteria bacterium]|jgi:TolB-like protein/DNA-binding winged helix-turn-helix (wHTH) protein|nr:winged helix-turn-helix domain-containing protein [Pseudomonadota bacterium]